MRTKMKMMLVKQGVTFSGEVVLKNIQQNDVLRLGKLFYEAYYDTIDYEGETPEQAVQEINDTINGKYGPFINDCSFVAEVRGRPVSFSLVTMWQGRPLLAYTATHPQYLNQGLSTNLIMNSINALLMRGHEDLYLFVTVGNEPARHVYEKLGFIPIT